MAEESQDRKDETPEPPKIKLRLEADASNMVRPIQLRPGGSKPAPEPKGHTARIDPATAQPPPPPEGEKRKTTRIDLAAAEPPKFDPRNLPPKAKTTRIDLAAAKPPTAEEHVQRGITERAPQSVHDMLKQRTIRIGADAQPAAPKDEGIDETQIPEAAKQTTMRIIIDEEERAPSSESTQKLKSQALKGTQPIESAKKQTSRIDLPASIEEKEADVLKRRTAAISTPAAPPRVAPVAEPPSPQPPKTIRIKRPEMPATKVLPRAPVPGSEETPVEAPTDRDIAQAKKSETARLDLPADVGERPPTRPKTIRIKRPDGTTSRKPMTLGQTTASEPEEPTGPSFVRQVALEDEEEESPGGVFVALTTIGVIVTFVLVYVLLAQTLAPTLPFPGRL